MTKKKKQEHKIEMIPIDEIIRNEKNPRYNDSAIPAVMKSIKEFGFNNPILVNKKKKILAGHTRLEACKRLGISEIPCIVIEHLTKSQEKAFLIADNKTAELAEWNNEVLNGLFTELKVEDFDLEVTAFTATEISSIADLFDYDDDDDAPEEEETEEPQSKSEKMTTLKLKLPSEYMKMFKAELKQWIADNDFDYVQI